MYVKLLMEKPLPNSPRSRQPAFGRSLCHIGDQRSTHALGNPKLNVVSTVPVASENEGANWSAFAGSVLYLKDSKKCFGIIRAALSRLKSVHDFPHNPKVAGSNPAPATN
jgi:hypothetical protein